MSSGVAGVMVSIVAFQAVDPGSIPGRRTAFCSTLWDCSFSVMVWRKSSFFFFLLFSFWFTVLGAFYSVLFVVVLLYC